MVTRCADTHTAQSHLDRPAAIVQQYDCQPTHQNRIILSRLLISLSHKYEGYTSPKDIHILTKVT